MAYNAVKFVEACRLYSQNSCLLSCNPAGYIAEAGEAVGSFEVAVGALSLDLLCFLEEVGASHAEDNAAQDLPPPFALSLVICLNWLEHLENVWHFRLTYSNCVNYDHLKRKCLGPADTSGFLGDSLGFHRKR